MYRERMYVEKKLFKEYGIRKKSPKMKLRGVLSVGKGWSHQPRVDESCQVNAQKKHSFVETSFSRRGGNNARPSARSLRVRLFFSSRSVG